MGLLLSTWAFDLLALVFLGAIGFYIYMTRNFNHWKKRGVKEFDTPIFLFGNIAPCIFGRTNPGGLLKKIYKAGEGEKMIGFYAFDRPYLLLRDPELIKDVLVRDFNNFSNKIMTGNNSDVLGANSIFMVHNPPWKNLRQKLTPVFTSGKLKNMFGLMLEIIEDFYEHLENLKIDEKVGKPVDIKDLTGKLMTDIIGTTAFGLKLNSLKNPSAEFRSHGKEMFRNGYKRYFELMSIFFLPTLRPFTNAKFFDEQGTEFLRKAFWDVINERIDTGIKRPDLIDLLIEITKNQDRNDEYKLEGDRLVAQAAIFFTGGFETTSTTLSFTLWELANSPQIQQRLRKEIKEGINKNSGKITYDMISTLPYLKMVVKESLRLHSILGWTDRVASEDYTFSGTNVTLKKGTPVLMASAAMQRDPKFFENPDTFDPERFSEANKAKIIPFTNFPFGEGPRNCLGARMGYIQVKLGLVALLSKYEIGFCKETLCPMEYEMAQTLTQPKGNLVLNLRKIS